MKMVQFCLITEIILYVSLLFSLYVFMKLQDLEIFSLFSRILLALVFPFLTFLILLLGAVGVVFVGILILFGIILFSLNKTKIIRI